MFVHSHETESLLLELAVSRSVWCVKTKCAGNVSDEQAQVFEGLRQDWK
jgi:hypothetical protein